MRVHITCGETSFVLPIPAAKLAEWTVSDLTGEVIRRLAGLRAPTETSDQAEPKLPAVLGLSLAGSTLCAADLVAEVLANDDKLVAHTEAPAKPAVSAVQDKAKETEASDDEEGGASRSKPTSLFGAAVLAPQGEEKEDDAAKSFVVSTKEVKNEETGELESHLMVTITEQNLKNVINNFVNDEVFYEERPTVEAETLFCHLSQFKSTANNHFRDTLKPLIAYLDKQFEVHSLNLLLLMIIKSHFGFVCARM